MHLLRSVVLISALVCSPAVRPAFAAASALPASADGVRPIGVGAKAPDATVRAPDGTAVQLATLFAAKPSVLIFYRGSWCPYCNRHLAALAEIEPQLLALGYQIIALSPDTLAGLGKATAKNQLAYRLFSDRELRAAAAFGVAFRVSDATAKAYTSRGIELAPIPAGEGCWLPVPAVYIIGRDGVIRFAHADGDYKARLAAADVIAAATKAAK